MMRITNNMMLRNASTNINGNKLNVNDLNSQMTSQKKIQRPSEDPVVAIRALRLRSSLSQINQYYEKNIPDADAWLGITETALDNMQKILADIRTQCDYGANGPLTTEDRDTILTNLRKLREQVYSEGNADYAGRTVFTGYRTNCKLTFLTEEKDTTYNITQTFSADSIDEEHRYYKGDSVVPTGNNYTDISKVVVPERLICDRIRFAYDSLDVTDTTNGKETELANLKISFTDGTKDANGGLVYDDITNMPLSPSAGAVNVRTYHNVEDWKADGFDVKDNEVVVIAETGEMLLGTDVSDAIKMNGYKLSVDYTKTGFTKGELRPEYYFNCTDVSASNKNPIEYQKYDDAGNEIAQDINYIVSVNQTLTVNTNASDVFDHAIGRDVDEMINAMQSALDAQDKVDQIDSMMHQAAYESEESQEALQKWLDAAKREADNAVDNVRKLYNTYIGTFDSYMKQVDVAITVIGSKGDQLEMTETRMSSQQLTIEELKSTNEDREISDIIIDYTSAYTAYQASLQAAGKLNQSTLLNYI